VAKAQAERQAAEHQAGDGDPDDLGGDQGAAAGGDEHGRDDRLVPVLAAGGDDAQHEHGHGADDTEHEHVVGAGRRAEGRSAVLAAAAAVAMTLITDRPTDTARVVRKVRAVASLRSSARVRRTMVVMTGKPPWHGRW
jgi:hypothetical protein